MINQQCAAKGSMLSRPTWTRPTRAPTGTRVHRSRKADEVTYMTTLADYMHGLGLAWIIKNPDDTGDNSSCDDMEPLAEGVTCSEQCNQYSTCTVLSAYSVTRPSSTRSTTSDDVLLPDRHRRRHERHLGSPTRTSTAAAPAPAVRRSCAHKGQEPRRPGPKRVVSGCAG